MSEEQQGRAPVRGAARKKAASSGGRRPARKSSGKSSGKKSPMALVAVGATLVIIAVVAFFLMNSKGDEKDTGSSTDKAVIEEPKVKEGDSLFDAAKTTEGASAADSGPVRVTGREPQTLDMSKLNEHATHLYVLEDLRGRINALNDQVEEYKKERWDVTPEMRSTFKDLTKLVDVARHHPFYEEADDALNGFNNYTAKREVHLRDESDELLPKPFIGFTHEPFLFMVQASKEGGEKEIADKVYGWLEQLKVAFVDYFNGHVELDPTERNKLITIVLFRRMQDYQAYNRIKNPERDRTFALAHYEPDAKRLCVPLEFGMNSAGEDPEHTLREVMFHEATHQLLHYYTQTEHLGAYGSMWSDEGVAEYFGGHGVENGKFIFGRVNSRIRAVAADGNDIKNRIDFIKLLTWTRFTHSKEEAKGGNAENLANYIHSHVYSQGWALVYFMNNFANGKYKKQFMEIMKRQIGKSGDAGLPVFRSVFPKDADFNQLEVEFNDYLDAMTDAWVNKKLKVGDMFQP